MEMRTQADGSGGKAIRAAFTVASRQELPAARLLAQAYRRHHPEHRFFVVLAAADGESDAMSGGGADPDTITLAHLALPNPDLFAIEQDSVALRSALAPFCIGFLFDTTAALAVLHLAPRCMVYRPLDEAWQALDSHDALLVPRRLGCEGAAAAGNTRDEGIYESGVFGVRRGPASGSLLGWWSRRAYDLLAGGAGGSPLDRVPACVDAAAILRDPAYGVGAGNLDERILTGSDEHAMVQGRRLATFDFAGYDPMRPDRIRAGDRALRLDTMPVVEGLCRRYGLQLQQAGGCAVAAAHGKLGNGVALVPAMGAVLRRCAQRGIATPSPVRDPDGFCIFLATPNPAVFGVDVAPLVTALLERRTDVAAAFPGAAIDKHDPGFGAWLSGAGAGEEQLHDWVSRFGGWLTADSGTAAMRGPREATVGAAASGSVRGRVLGWLGRVGAMLPPGSVHAAGNAAEAGFARVLEAYFSRLELLSQHPLLYTDDAIARLALRLRESLVEFPGLQAADVDAFVQLAGDRRDALLLASLRYNPSVRRRIGGLPSALNLPQIQDFLVAHGAGGAVPHVTAVLLSREWIDPALQFRAFCESEPRVRQLFPDAARVPAEAMACAYFVLDRHACRTSHAAWEDWNQRVLLACREPARAGVNLAGYLHGSTGMGESARSMARTLAHAGMETALSVIPSGFPDPGVPSAGLASLFGTIEPQLDVNVVVANADDLLRVREWLPEDVWAGRRNVGYWVWETETAPARFADAARGLDAVWTPSAYSAAAIAAVVDLPVQVVPHLPDFDALDAARPAREAFGLPADALLFGYFFDAKSDLERKNPAALIEAFRGAFGGRSDVGLVLKVSSPSRGSYAFESLKAAAAGLNVIWIERPLTRAQSCNLMASLDVYVSLHRAEGFGLTMAEAMAIGKPVIATGYSGNLDFMDAGSAWLVEHGVVSTGRAHGPYPAGSRWSEPSVAHAVALMRGAESRADRAALGLAARRHLRRVLDPDAIGRRAGEALRVLRASGLHGTPAVLEAPRA